MPINLSKQVKNIFPSIIVFDAVPSSSENTDSISNLSPVVRKMIKTKMSLKKTTHFKPKREIW